MVSSEVRQSLQRLFDYFRTRLENAKGIEEGKIEGYILPFTVIDALAFYATGKQVGAHMFHEFIIQYSGFRETYNRISIPLLVQQLRLRKPKSCRAITDWAAEVFYLKDHYVKKNSGI